MLFLLLTACDDGDSGAAVARADAFLDEHPRGTAIVQVPVGREGIEAVVGTTWQGVDLASWLAPCGDVEPFEAVVELNAGTYPAKMHLHVDLPPCVRERLLSFPFDGPSRVGESDLVRVRWRPGEAATPVVARGLAEGGLAAGLVELAPPYWRRDPEGDALVEGKDLHLDEGRIRIRPTRGADLVAGPLEAPEVWARALTCDAEALALVRVTLAFEDGYLETVATWPENDCVEERARANRKALAALPIDGDEVRDGGNVLVVLDVPVGAW